MSGSAVSLSNVCWEAHRHEQSPNFKHYWFNLRRMQVHFHHFFRRYGLRTSGNIGDFLIYDNF
jgi:hypothetical protein